MSEVITDPLVIRAMYEGTGRRTSNEDCTTTRTQSMWSEEPQKGFYKENIMFNGEQYKPQSNVSDADFRAYAQEEADRKSKLSRSERESERVDSIRSLAKNYNQVELGIDAIANKTSLEDFKRDLLRTVSNSSSSFTAPSIHTGNHTYNYADAIRQASTGKLEGLVAEFNSEMKRTKGEGRSTRSIYIPSMFETRVLGDSAPIIPTQVANYEKFLAKSGLAQQLGARIFNIDSASVKVPVITALPSASVLDLDGSNVFSASDSTLGSATFVPKTFGALSEYSRELLMQSNQAETIVRDSLMQAVSRKVDEVMLDGSGTGAEPTGLGNDADILQVTYANGTSLDFDALRDGVEALQNIDYPVNGVKMVVNPADYKSLINTERGGSGSGSFVFEPNLQSDGAIASYLGIPVYVSKFVDSGKCVIGHFDKFGIGQFNGMELLADEVIESGKLQVRLFYDADMHVLDNNAFVRITEAS